MVGNGNGPVAPGCRLLYRIGGHRQGIHVGHTCVQMQLHPLAVGGSILPLLHGPGHHGIGLEHHLIFKPVLDGLALDPQHRADFHVVQNGLGLPCLQKAADAHRVGVVGHVELYHPGVALFQLLVVHVENPALYNHRAHIQAQVLHGNRRSLEGFAVEGLAGGRRLGFRLLAAGPAAPCRQTAQQILAHGVHGIEQGLPLQGLPRRHRDGHRSGKPFPQHRLDLGNQLFQLLFPVGHQLNGQSRAIPGPLGSRERPPGHGVPADEQLHQLLRLYAVKLVLRMGGRQFHPPQAVKPGNFLPRLIQQPLGDIQIPVQCHMNRPLLHMDIRSDNGRLRQGCIQPLRRLVVREHIVKCYLLVHSDLFLRQSKPSGRKDFFPPGMGYRFSIRRSRAGSSCS